MQFALQADIENLKKRGGSSIKVVDGEFVEEKSDYYLYDFMCNSTKLLDEETDLEVKVGNRITNGSVVAISEDGKVSISLEEYLGSKIPEAQLTASSYQLLVKLQEHLEGLRTGTIGHHDLSEKLFRLKQFQHGSDEEAVLPISRQLLNQSQEAATRLALGSEVSFIWGPPGTGKTFTIARLAEALLDRGLSILLISHTNTATDGALESIVRHLEDSDYYQNGELLRLGRITNEYLKDKYVTLENIAAAKSKAARDELDNLRKREAKIHERLSSHDKLSEQNKELEQLKREQDNIKKYILEARTKGEELQSNIVSIEGSIKEYDRRIREFQKLGTIKKLFSGTSLDKLTKERGNLRLIYQRTNAKLDKLRDEYKTAIKDKNAITQEYEAGSTKLKGKGLLDKEDLLSLRDEADGLNDAINAATNEIEEMSSVVIGTAKLIATTLTKSYKSKEVLLRDYDCIIVDEASMAPLPALFSAAGLAKQKVVIVGDCFQLSPIARYDMPDQPTENDIKMANAVTYWLKQNIYDYLEITDSITKGKCPPFMLELKEQNRMHPEIAGLVNALVYDRKNHDFALTSGQRAKQKGSEIVKAPPLTNSHLGIYDTSKIGSIPTRGESGSTYNLPQAFLIVELLKKAIQEKYESIGVISAYRAQTDLIRRLSQDIFTKEQLELVQIDTVHKFQGNEKDLIIFDITTPKPGSMYDDGSLNDEASRLINVAVSRAEGKCILVCDADKIRKANSETSLIKMAIDYCDKHELPIIDATTAMPKEQLSTSIDKLFSVKLEGKISDKDLVILKDDTFYDAFYKDLANASKELIILCPFITEYRSNILKPYFKNFMDKGGRIYILTRPPELHPMSQANMRVMAQNEIKEYEDMGIVVLPMPKISKMHEKVVIIDRRILYHGSLNVLSFRDTGEEMIRFTAKTGNFPERYMKETGLIKNLGTVLGQTTLKHCEICTSPGAWYWTDRSRYGFWTHCLVGSHSPGKPPKERKPIEAIRAARQSLRNNIELGNDNIPICPVHHLKTVLKPGVGSYPDYYACPKGRECDYKLNVNKYQRYINGLPKTSKAGV